MAYHYVVCKICGIKFNRDKEPFVMISANRYAHKECAGKKITQEQQDELDLKELEKYVMNLLGERSVNATIRKQIMNYRKEYGYTYSGILKTLIYWYDIKKNPKASAKHNIGIVPYVWDQAKDYYYRLFLADSLNSEKNILAFLPKKKILEIPVPKQKKKKIKLFDLGDDKNE